MTHRSKRPAVNHKAAYHEMRIERRERIAERKRDRTTAVNVCGKRGYRTQRLAIGALIVAQKRGRDERRLYPCAQCGDWHLTSQAKR